MDGSQPVWAQHPLTVKSVINHSRCLWLCHASAVINLGLMKTVSGKFVLRFPEPLLQYFLPGIQPEREWSFFSLYVLYLGKRMSVKHRSIILFPVFNFYTWPNTQDAIFNIICVPKAVQNQSLGENLTSCWKLRMVGGGAPLFTNAWS